MPKKIDPEVKDPIVEDPNDKGAGSHNSDINIANLIGEPTAKIVAALNSHKDYEAVNFIKVKNVTYRLTDVDNNQNFDSVRLVVARNLPTYLTWNGDGDVPNDLDPDDRYLGTTSILYTTPMQISGILKEMGEMSFAARVLTHPEFITRIFEGGGRVSAFKRDYVAGEIEQNPFSTKVGTYEFDRATTRYYIYDIELGEVAKKLKDQMLLLEAAKLVG